MKRYDSNLVRCLASLDKPYTALDIIYNYTYTMLVYHNFNRTRAAKSMKISIRGLRNRINEMRVFGFDIPDGRLGCGKE